MKEDALHEHIGAIVRTARDGLDLLRGDLPANEAKIRAVVHSVRDALLSVEQCLASWSRAISAGERVGAVQVCPILAHTEDVRCAMEELCRQHGVRIEIAATPLLPAVAGIPERVAFLLLTILEYVVRLAVRDSVVRIALTEVAMRHSAGVEWRAVARTTAFSERDRYQLYEVLGAGAVVAPVERGGVAPTLFDRLASCRRVVDSMRGELWVERGSDGAVTFVVLLPAVQVVAMPAAPERVKLDVVVQQRAMVLEAAGEKALGAHLRALEAVVRQVVRHPRDAVMLFESRGLISVIAQATKESASAVVARMRQAIVEHGLGVLGATAIQYDFRVTKLP